MKAVKRFRTQERESVSWKKLLMPHLKVLLILVLRFEAIPEIFLSEVSKLIDSVMNRRQKYQRKQIPGEKRTQ